MQYLLKKGDTTTRTQRITGHSGCELNHVFETKSTGGLEPIYLSSNNNGVVFQTKVVGGYEGDPAVQEQLTETYIMPEPTPGVAESGQFSIDVTSLVAGDITVRFNDLTPDVPVTLDGTEDASAIYDLIVAATPSGWTSTKNTTSITIANDEKQANTLKIEISAGTTGIVVTEESYTLGSNPLTVTPGDIEVFYNSEEATLVTLDGTETLGDVYDKIALSVPEGYTATDDESIVILKTVAGANIIPLSIDLGSTGITKDTSVLIPGEDENNDSVPKATSVATEYTLDTISNVRNGTALWNEIDTIASGNTKLASVAYPVTAVRLNVKTAARDSTAQVILRTSA